VRMSPQFADILRGLMENRRLSPSAVASASGRDESTISQLLAGSVSPSVEILHDIAPVLQLPVADLLIIGGVSGEPDPDRITSPPAGAEIFSLVVAAGHLSTEQLRELIEIARNLLPK
jgi:transcriptional regulator with XRE-family HTH domain